MKKTLCSLILMLGICLMCGCTKENNAETVDTQIEHTDSTQASTENLPEQEIKEESLSEKAPVAKQFLYLYYSNEDADGLELELQETEEIKYTDIIQALKGYMIMPEDTQVLTFKEEKTEDDQFKKLTIDLSAEFGAYLSEMGSSGEYIIMSSICNSFLDTYGAKEIMVLCEGQTIETGHTSYDKPQSHYPTASYQILSEVYETDNVKIRYPKLANMPDSNTELEWNEIFELFALKELEFITDGQRYELDYEVKTASKELVSIVYYTTIQENEAEEYHYIQSFNIDLNSGKELRLSDFIDCQKVKEDVEVEEKHYILPGQIEDEAFLEFVQTNAELLTTEYYEQFDISFMDPNADCPGYSYKIGNRLFICIEVPHALGDFVEIMLY